MDARTATLERETRETRIRVELNIDGAGVFDIETGIPFMNHMLELFGRHSGLDLTLKATGDIEVDYHHEVEDIGLVLGEALDKALGDRAGIRRYGDALLPMDDALSRVAVDLGGRPFLVYHMANRTKKIRDFNLCLIEEFFRAFTIQGRMNLHIEQLYGKEPHHAYESVFKGVARALRAACEPDPRYGGEIPSSKGRI
ncbi:Imidazoleglycerol-phosphate dehydratase [Kiritimatiella glycovorans]|uniref:Imidazoleglycerol-phosphate dehydratase n=2 Tax=Kiritimatiella glycovorans TaxID=1307763 RepID=A0A0G3EKE0_9BACT|nr:Imidazoleglycerol-phosphate dehydratase [Kiritimatiella glycovorans]